MPTYDYVCATTGQVVEVKHRMSESAATWGELCALAGRDVGDVPADAPVSRLATGGNVVSGRSLKNPAPVCANPMPGCSGPCGHVH